MKFGEAVRYCMRNIFVFEGRARRSEFWWFYLFLSIISMVAGLIFAFAMVIPFIPVIASSDAYGVPDPAAVGGSVVAFFVIYGLYFLFSIALSVSLLGATARRLHDTGQSGHWLWLNLAGLGIVPLVMCIMDGQPYANQWGPDPKAAEREAMARAYAQYAQQAASYPAQPAAPSAPAAPTTGAAQADPFSAPPSA